MKNRINQKKGSVALEVIMSGSVLVIILFVVLGYFVFLYPRYMVELEVQTLAHEVRTDGYLSYDAYQAFVDNMEERGYLYSEGELDPVYDKDKFNEDDTYGVGVFGPTGMNLMGVDSDGNRIPVGGYDKLNRGEGRITLYVKVPSSQGILRTAGKSLGIVAPSNHYHFKRVVMPESYEEFKDGES